ncbi:MAG: hypothetical protein NTV86_03960 [Planctomycetota bacterium]|nr:hypothetical protein [Planctomycetota bacterium]
MKPTALLTVALTLAAAVGSACPVLANRDPGSGGMYGSMPPRVGQAGVGEQYKDGMSLYPYGGGNPINRLDPSGLKWKVLRTGQPRAMARADCDPIDDLADLIGLDKEEWTHWLSPWGPKSPSQVPNAGVITGNEPGYDFQVVTVDGKVMAKGQFAIPNTIEAAWAGWEGLGREGAQFYVMWGKDITDLKAKGFAVHEVTNVKAAALLGDFTTLTHDESLHGFLFWGHGGTSGLTTKESENGSQTDDYRLKYDDVSNGLAYKLGFGMVYACNGNRAKPFMMSPGASFWGGADDTDLPGLIPAPFHLNAPTVGELLRGKE